MLVTLILQQRPDNVVQHVVTFVIQMQSIGTQQFFARLSTGIKHGCNDIDVLSSIITLAEVSYQLVSFLLLIKQLPSLGAGLNCKVEYPSLW